MDKEGITEAASINTPKRKRGRPTKFDLTEDVVLFACAFAADKTRRTKMNMVYAFNAAAHLRVHTPQCPELGWLLGFILDEQGNSTPSPEGHENRFRTEILTELGRVISRWSNGDTLAFAWAKEICEMKPRPTTKDAVRMIRRSRLDREKKKGNVFVLWQRLSKVIDDYCAQYTANKASIADDLRLLADDLELMAEKEHQRNMEAASENTVSAEN